MTFILIGLLFLLQLVSFYIIALLYSKINKINDIEKKQQQVLDEIDHSFGAYIAEMKEENNRLLQELKSTDLQAASAPKIIPKETTSFPVQKSYTSKQTAASNYLKMVAATEKKVPTTIKEKVLFYHEEEKSIGEIAKLLQIGKTEVELLLKFKDNS